MGRSRKNANQPRGQASGNAKESANTTKCRNFKIRRNKNQRNRSRGISQSDSSRGRQPSAQPQHDTAAANTYSPGIPVGQSIEQNVFTNNRGRSHGKSNGRDHYQRMPQQRDGNRISRYRFNRSESQNGTHRTSNNTNFFNAAMRNHYQQYNSNAFQAVESPTVGSVSEQVVGAPQQRSETSETEHLSATNTLNSPHKNPFADKDFRKGLSGAGVKWYTRFVQLGHTPEVARQKVLDRKQFLPTMKETENINSAQPAAVENRSLDTQRDSNERAKPLIEPPNNAGPNEIQNQITKMPTSSARTSDHDSDDDSSEEELNKSTNKAQPTAPAETPHSSKRSLEQSFSTHQPAVKKSKPPTDADSDCSSETSTERDTPAKNAAALTKTSHRIAVIPKEYPGVILTEEQLMALEDCILNEVAKGHTTELAFEGVHFKAGYLLVDCTNVGTAKWLCDIAARLQHGIGIEIISCPNEKIPKSHAISLYLPRSLGQSREKTMALLAAQNVGLKTALWRVTSCKDEKKGQIMNAVIDNASFKQIMKNDAKLNYRFGKISVVVGALGQSKNPSNSSKESLVDGSSAVCSPNKKPKTAEEDVDVIPIVSETPIVELTDSDSGTDSDSDSDSDVPPSKLALVKKERGS